MGLFSWLVLVGILLSAIGGIIWWLAAFVINKTVMAYKNRPRIKQPLNTALPDVLSRYER